MDMNNVMINNKKCEVEIITFPQNRCHQILSRIPFFFQRNKHHTDNLLTTNNNMNETKTLLAVRPHPSRILRAGRRKHNWGNMNNPDKMAILIRSDLKLPTGRIIHFSASIAIRLFQRACNPSNNLCSAWDSSGQKKVVHPIENDLKMTSLIRYARQNNITVAGVRVKVPPNSNNSSNNSGSNRGRNRSGSSNKLNRKRIVTVQNNKNNKYHVQSEPTPPPQQQQQHQHKSSDEHQWVAIGLFGPEQLLNKMTKNLPRI